MSEWQPIETAPKDGTEVRLFWGGIHDGTVGHYDCGGWGFTDSSGHFADFTNTPLGWIPVQP